MVAGCCETVFCARGGFLMYEAYYGLREKPFSIMPDPDLIYWGRAHRMAFSMLEFGVMNNAQFTVITGEVGSGKRRWSDICCEAASTAAYNVGLISNTPQGRDELLQWIMMSLNLPFEGSIPRLLKILQDFLYSHAHRAPNNPDRRRSAKPGRGRARRFADAFEYQRRQVSIPANDPRWAASAQGNVC